MTKSKQKQNDIAVSAVTVEDLEFEAALQRMAEVELPPVIDDPEPPGSIVKIERPRAEMLKEAVPGTLPASSDQDLREQIYTAKQHDCDSIEATLAIAKRFCKDPALESVGYFLMQDIKVYIEGAFEKAVARDRQSIEQRNFGGSRIG